jgi:hypothetical protein
MTQTTAIAFRKLNDDQGSFAVTGDEIDLHVSKLFERNPAGPGDLPMFAICLTNKISGKLTKHYVYMRPVTHNAAGVNYPVVAELYADQVIAGLQDQYLTLGGFLGDTKPEPVEAPIEFGEIVSNKGKFVNNGPFGGTRPTQRTPREFSRHGYDALWLQAVDYDTLRSNLISAIFTYLTYSPYTYRTDVRYQISSSDNMPNVLAITSESTANPSLSIELRTATLGVDQYLDHHAVNEAVIYSVSYDGVDYILRLASRAQYDNEWSERQIVIMLTMAFDAIRKSLAGVYANEDFVKHLTMFDNYTHVLPKDSKK